MKKIFLIYLQIEGFKNYQNIFFKFFSSFKNMKFLNYHILFEIIYQKSDTNISFDFLTIFL